MKRDWSVWFNGRKIGRVAPDPSDGRVNHRWDYFHVSKTTLGDLHPEWPPERREQTNSQMGLAAESLLRLDKRIAREAVA